MTKWGYVLGTAGLNEVISRKSGSRFLGTCRLVTLEHVLLSFTKIHL